MNTRALTSFAAALVTAGLVVISGCGGKQEGQEEAPAGGYTTVDPATAATITGTVKFEGTAPKPELIKTDADPKCKEIHANNPLYARPIDVNGNGTLKDVFVYVKAGLEGKHFAVPSTAVEINQQGCEYHPHVFGIQVGQKLLIRNSDPTLHNIHARAVVNAEFNVGQPNQGMTTTKSFSKVEVMLPFRCDVHNWMNAFCGVLEHPYYAVTGDNGTFSIGNLPPGTYTLVAWQEKLGTQQATVTVGPKETKDVAFTFAAK